MSDQGYTAAQDNNANEDTGVFCQNCSPTTRKVGYYLTFAVGFILFVFGVILIATLTVTPLICGSLIIIFCPLWIKSPRDMCIALKNPVRITSTLIFIGFLIATIVVYYAIDSTILNIIFGVCLGLAGIWYFLSYFENGQEAALVFCKTCCKKSTDQQGQGQGGETVEEGQV